MLHLKFPSSPLTQFANQAKSLRVSGLAFSFRRGLSRQEEARILQSIWRGAGAIPEDLTRQCFIRTARAAGLSATCPKGWRHTFATLMQEANVDLLPSQETVDN